VPDVSSVTDINGLLLVDKPLGISSFDVIRALRRRTGVRKIGHAGTLDPLASGLMLMLFGSGCKKAIELTGLDKHYAASITLGANSTTGDDEGEKLPVSDKVPIRSQIEAAMKLFTGEITQVPSPYSAIKIRGKEAYKRARAGETVEMPSRQVRISEITLVRYEYPILQIRASVSSGTYIRTLAEDLGGALGTGGYLSGLERTRVGVYTLQKALSLDDIDASVAREKILVI
jgi:tRNA pseudouridine55 synthase